MMLASSDQPLDRTLKRILGVLIAIVASQTAIQFASIPSIGKMV